MPKIRFLLDCATKEKVPQVFKKDQVVTFPDTEVGNASAQHWVNRGKAELVDAPLMAHQSGTDHDHEAGTEHSRSGGFSGPVKGSPPPLGATTPPAESKKKG